ncbi:tetratricopeptide repeat protein [Phytomonospora sp. NPDC050363]|uniref:tetratricopeptide repeat protein n=1 Tax=Phytomonospora sp. NPDC050363 TaxID=3155642 RepID=UPI0033EF060D
MSTDLYGVRVLEVAPAEPRVRFRVFVVYYDTGSRTHAPLPDDPSFFLSLLWEASHREPLTSLHPLWMVSAKQIVDEAWIAAETHRYVRGAERVETRNHPVTDDLWPRLSDFYYLRDDGWHDEETLVQADYDVEVTDPRWLAALSPGQTWATTSYSSRSDLVTEPEAPAVLELRRPALTLDPFTGEEDDGGTPGDLAFSDDGRFLAVTNQACELVVFDTGDWSERTRIAGSPLWGQDVRWIPGTHLVTGRDLDEEPEAGARVRAYDVDAGAETEVTEPPLRATPHGAEARRLANTAAGSGEACAIRPDGAHLVTGDGDDPGRGLSLWRVADGKLLTRCLADADIVRELAWSPDGTTLAASVITGWQGYGGEFRLYRAGQPVRPPAEVSPTVAELRALAAETHDPQDSLLLLDLLIESEQDPAAIGRAYRDKAKALRHTDPPAATEAYRRAVELGGSTNALHASRELALLLRDLGDLDGAVESVRTAHRIAGGRDLASRNNRKSLAEVLVLLADLVRTRAGQGDHVEASALYRKAIDLGAPKPGWAHLGLGWTATEIGDDEAAEPLLLRALELAPADLSIRGYASMLLGGIAKKRRNLAEALRWYRQAFKADDAHRPLATGHLGELHYLLDETEQARVWYERMLRATDDPELVAEGCCRLGELAARDGDRQVAVDLLNRAVATGSGAFADSARNLLGDLTGGRGGS